MGWLSDDYIIGIGYTQLEAMKDLVKTYNRSNLSKRGSGRLIKNEDSYVMAVDGSSDNIREITVEEFLQKESILSGTNRTWIARTDRDGITNYRDSLNELSI